MANSTISKGEGVINKYLEQRFFLRISNLNFVDLIVTDFSVTGLSITHFSVLCLSVAVRMDKKLLLMNLDTRLRHHEKLEA